MGYEDFTTYTESDPENDVTKTATKITVTNADPDPGSYVYKDKGVGHFGTSFTHLVETKASKAERYALGCVWAVSNGVGDRDDMGNHLMVYWYGAAGGTEMFIEEKHNGGYKTDHIALSVDTKYYLTITRSANGATLTCVIRTGSHSGTVVDTIEITGLDTGSYRYIYGEATRSVSGETYEISYEVENLNLQEGVAHSKTVSEILGLVDTRARVKQIHRDYSEILGLVDTRARVKQIHRTKSEILGLVDVKSSVHGRYKTVSEVLGLVDTRARVKQIHRDYSEILGLVDSKSSVHGRYKTVSEVLGLKDLDPRVNVCPKCKKGAVVLVF